MSDTEETSLVDFVVVSGVQGERYVGQVVFDSERLVNGTLQKAILLELQKNGGWLRLDSARRLIQTDRAQMAPNGDIATFSSTSILAPIAVAAGPLNSFYVQVATFLTLENDLLKKAIEELMNSAEGMETGARAERMGLVAPGQLPPNMRSANR